MASPSKVAAARERYETLLVAAQQEFDKIQEQRLALSERLSVVEDRLMDIQMALDVFASAPAHEESTAEPPSAPDPQEATPAATRVLLRDLRGLDAVDAALLLAKQHRQREVDAETVTGWLQRAGYRSRRNKAITQNAVSAALGREHNLGEGNVVRVSRGIYRLNW